MKYHDGLSIPFISKSLYAFIISCSSDPPCTQQGKDKTDSCL
jgi:hypothetical protein